MSSPGTLLAWLAAPALLTLALVLSWGLWDSPLPPGLSRELERRRLDLRRLEATAAAAAAATPRGRAPAAPSPPPPHPLLGCADLARVAGVGFVGSGITKRVLRASLASGSGGVGEELALKSVHWEGHDVSRCVQRYGHPAGCYRLAVYKLLQEAVWMRSLDHPGIVKLRGQCYDSGSAPEMKVVTMMELGAPLEMLHLLQTPWEERFKICLDLAELLYYLANSPLGSIALLDFQTRQFVMVNGSLKVADLDDVSSNELSCQTDDNCILEFPTIKFSLRCSTHGKCEGINEKRNLFNAYRYFFTYLLPHTAPFDLQPLLKDILNATGDLRYGANETLRAFQKVLHLYKSGLYLQEKTSHLKDYVALKGFRSKEAEDYKCWPSYSHLGCLLSVPNLEGAATICNSHPQCQHFIITSQRIWTGHPLALFRSNVSDLIPGGNMEVYIKRSAASRSLRQRSWGTIEPVEKEKASSYHQD